MNLNLTLQSMDHTIIVKINITLHSANPDSKNSTRSCHLINSSGDLLFLGESRLFILKHYADYRNSKMSKFQKSG